MLPRSLPRALATAASRAPTKTSSIAAARAATKTDSTMRALSTTSAQRAADHGGHDSHYDAPGGWLWGVPPGEKREREGWEIPFFTMYCGSIVVAVVAYSMKEDTS